MLDIQFIRDNPQVVKDGIAKKQYDPSLVGRVLKLDSSRRKLLAQVEELRREGNVVAAEKIGRNVVRGKEIKKRLKKLELQLKDLAGEYRNALESVPNLPAKGVPDGESEKDNVELKMWSQPKDFGFKAKDHVELGKNLDILDFETGAKVTGSEFYYLKNEGVLLELALVQYGIDFLIKKGFTPFITPDIAKEKFYVGTGYLPRGPEAQIYTISDSDLGLIATAEVTLAGYHADQVLTGRELPKKYAGYSHCFRMEAGSYGKYSRGLYRVHQFTKVEMFAFAKPEESAAIHEEFLANEEEFWQSLEIPYRVLEMCTGDLGAQAARKFDLEAWMPGRGDWGEVTSTSNTTDYQARRLNIKYREGADRKYVHTLNGTLVATSRAIIAILENKQQKDGSVVIPRVLHTYMGGKEKIIPKV